MLRACPHISGMLLFVVIICQDWTGSVMKSTQLIDTEFVYKSFSDVDFPKKWGDEEVMYLWSVI